MRRRRTSAAERQRQCVDAGTAQRSTDSCPQLLVTLSCPWLSPNSCHIQPRALDMHSPYSPVWRPIPPMVKDLTSVCW
jgi:hypothetical protein